MAVLFERMVVDVLVGEWVDVGVGELLALLGETAVLENMDLGGGDAAAVYGFELQACVDVEGSGGVLEHMFGDAGVDQGAEEHVAGDPGEAV